LLSTVVGAEVVHIDGLAFASVMLGIIQGLATDMQTILEHRRTAASCKRKHFYSLFWRRSRLIIESTVFQVGQRALPGVFFFYDLSAIKVSYTETHPSLQFLTNLYAIVGGICLIMLSIPNPYNRLKLAKWVVSEGCPQALRSASRTLPTAPAATLPDPREKCMRLQNVLTAL
nr:endoplasmic reticulum-Golgi intermediate compartment protein 3-like [Tanacetum cinerariifolium]